MKTISTKKLKEAFSRIIKKLEFEEIIEIKLETDLYRYIPTDKWTEFDKNIIEVGSLYDDLESILLMVEDTDRPCTYIDFDRIASLLRAISQQNNPPN